MYRQNIFGKRFEVVVRLRYLEIEVLNVNSICNT